MTEYGRRRITGKIDTNAVNFTYSFVDTTSGKTITASSAYGGYPATNTTDDNTGTRWTQSDGSMPQWLKVDFSTGVYIYQYSILCLQGGEVVSAWTFDGSNDDSNWTTLDTQSGQNPSSRTVYYVPLGNVNSYRYYRLYMTAPNGWISIHELEMSQT